MKKLLLLLLFMATIHCQKATPIDLIPNHQTFTLSSKILNENRTINVWLPENYENSTDSLYVLYMPDGGLQEDFPHIANTLAALIKDTKLPQVILVGIENTERRRDLTGPTTVEEDKKIAPVVGGSANFRAFIKEELFPIINKKYRTTARKGIIGESLAGLFIIETLQKDSEMFDDYIAIDPSLWWNNKKLLATAASDLKKITAEKKLWFAGSGTTDISVTVQRLEIVLKAESRSNLTWKFSPEPNEEHSTIYRATKEKALIWTFSNFKKQ